MTRIKFDTDTLKLMAFFESATGAKLKDCFTDSLGTMTFVIEEGIAKAIGKSGSTFKKLEVQLKRKIKVVAYSEDVQEFIANIIMPLKATQITFNPDDKTITISAETESRGYIIGRAASSLRNYESIVQRYFEIKEIKVL